MRILIVEDEPLLAKRLQKMLLHIVPEAVCCGMTTGVEETVRWLSENEQPDLVMMDIELADGQSFEIFKLVECNAPVIFTTAYNEFTLKAFKVDSIDYLLKPIQEEELKMAINKFRKKWLMYQSEPVKQLLEKIEQLSQRSALRRRFLIRQGQKMISLDISEVAFIFSENKYTFIRTFRDQKFLIDTPLDTLEKELPPQQFFRANRQYMITSQCVVAIHTWFNQKLKVELKPQTNDHIVISREKAHAFKAWMGE